MSTFQSNFFLTLLSLQYNDQTGTFYWLKKKSTKEDVRLKFLIMKSAGKFDD